MILALTHGDINGIGYEVILKTFADERMCELCTPVLYGSSRMLQWYRKQLELDTRYHVIQDISQAKAGVLNVIDVLPKEADTVPQPGVASPEAGAAALASLQAALDAVRSGRARALVTAPINKHNIHGRTFDFVGHTEFLAAAAGEDCQPLMVLFNDNLRVALVTTHMPMADIPAAITHQAVLDKLRLFNRSLHRDFGVHRPRIAVLSLNPHAGEDGLLGNEEKDVIIPAIEQAKQEKILAFGPYAADGFFGSGRFVKFDGVLAMYHDQGLAPFKTMAMDDGVNFTAGLPWVRTSPDHGTGYDISGTGEASAESLRRAVYAAIDIVRNRAAEDEAHRSPLRRQYFDKGQDNVKLDLTKD